MKHLTSVSLPRVATSGTTTQKDLITMTEFVISMLNAVNDLMGRKNVTNT